MRSLGATVMIFLTRRAGTIILQSSLSLFSHCRAQTRLKSHSAHTTAGFTTEHSLSGH